MRHRWSGAYQNLFRQILTLGTGTTFILVCPKYQGKRYRTFRVCTFICTGLSGFAPLAHGCVRFGFAQMMKQSGMPYYLLKVCCSCLGLALYRRCRSTVFYTSKVAALGDGELLVVNVASSAWDEPHPITRTQFDNKPYSRHEYLKPSSPEVSTSSVARTRSSTLQS